jgi:chromosome partitioning protein
MTQPVVAFFNNKGGVGKTSLVYHLAWMYAELGVGVLAVDLDPQANLTAAFFDEEDVIALWPDEGDAQTVFGSIRPLLRGIGDVAAAPLIALDDKLALLPGDLALSQFEDELSSQWPDCLDGKERAFRVISAFHRLIADGIRRCRADLALVDVGPNLGAINRAALVAATHVVVPLAPDLFSLQGLRNLGPTLRRWRGEWQARLPHNPDAELDLPAGRMSPIGYVLQQHGVRLGQPVAAYQRWMQRIPPVYRKDVLDEGGEAPLIDDDPNCLAQLKHYHSLVPMALDARKPVFALKPADGAFGGHQKAVQHARRDFADLATTIAERAGASRLRATSASA